MRYPVSEALDRYSILWLKRFFGCDVDAEFEAIENYLRDELHEDWQLVRNSVQLGTCNALQWMLEECVSPFEDDECVAQAAIEIRAGAYGRHGHFSSHTHIAPPRGVQMAGWVVFAKEGRLPFPRVGPCGGRLGE